MTKPAPNPAIVTVVLTFRGVAADPSKILAGLDAQFPTVSMERDGAHSGGYGPLEFVISP